jgi:hypothetical protein
MRAVLNRIRSYEHELYSVRGKRVSAVIDPGGFHAGATSKRRADTGQNQQLYNQAISAARKGNAC